MRVSHINRTLLLFGSLPGLLAVILFFNGRITHYVNNKCGTTARLAQECPNTPKEQKKTKTQVKAKSILTKQERTERAKHNAISRHVGPGSRADQGRRTRHSSKSKRGHWPVPEHVTKDLCQADVFYFESIQQPENNTCGSRSLANGLAISDAIALGVLNPKTVKRQAACYEWMHTTDNLTNVDIVKYAKKLGLENVYVIDYLNKDLVKKNRKKSNPFTIISSTDHKETVCGANEMRINQCVIEKIRSRSSITAHFICFLDSVVKGAIAHAVLVSLIKRPGKKPTIIYMDSCNTPLRQEWQSAAYMSYLYWQCIAP